MIIRLKVNGFKNLVDVDVRFGPFTCIAGVNGVGKHLLFDHSAKDWRATVVKAGRRAPFFISTEGQGDATIIKLHQDGGSSGRPLPRPASNLPRTVLSAANAAESPTVLCARREMESWRILQLEPSALRKPDEINAPPPFNSERRSSSGNSLPSGTYTN